MDTYEEPRLDPENGAPDASAQDPAPEAAWQQPRTNDYAPPEPPQAPKRARSRTVLCLALCLVMVVVGCGITGAVVSRHWQEENRLLQLNFQDRLDALQSQIDQAPGDGTGDSTSGTPNTGTEGGLTPAQVFARNVQSVVAIKTTGTNTDSGLPVTFSSSGSGFILTQDGFIVTNYHVVEGASQITVALADGTEHNASYIGGDQSNDIALLKIELSGLQPVTIGRSSELIVGDQVAAIGDPLGELSSTLTVGFVSAKDRLVSAEGTRINMIQTDAAINSGNSGGPLFNMKGQVIGITTAKYSGTSTSGATIEGIGFAIPIDDVYGMLEDLRQFGYITGAYLGVTVSDMDPTHAALYGLPMGALVREVTDGSCAQAGGIQAQDIIVELGGYKIESLNDLTRALRQFKAGDEISVVVYRHSQGGQKILSVTLDEKPRPQS